MGARRLSALTLAVPLVCGCWVIACHRSSDPSDSVPEVSPSNSAADRLVRGEALPGRPLAFGIEVPPPMQVNAEFNDLVQLSGPTGVRELVSYFAKHTNVVAVEMTSSGARFARVSLKGDTSGHVYDIEISREGTTSYVRMKDVTAPPRVQGLSDADRWQRAGMNPDGTVKDRLQQY